MGDDPAIPRFRPIPAVAVVFFVLATIGLAINLATIFSYVGARHCPKYPSSDADRNFTMSAMTLIVYAVPGLPTFLVARARGNAVVAACSVRSRSSVRWRWCCRSAYRSSADDASIRRSVDQGSDHAADAGIR